MDRACKADMARGVKYVFKVPDGLGSLPNQCRTQIAFGHTHSGSCRFRSPLPLFLSNTVVKPHSCSWNGCNDRYISRLCCCDLEGTIQVVKTGSVGSNHVVCAIVVFHQATGTIDAVYFHILAGVDSFHKRNWL